MNKMGLPKVGQGYYTMNKMGKLSLPKVGECDYTADNGQTYREYLLTKEHRNVLADIRTLCEQLNLDVLTFQHIYLDG